MHRLRFSMGSHRFSHLGTWASTNQEGAVGHCESRLKAAVGDVGKVTNSVGIGAYQQRS